MQNHTLAFFALVTSWDNLVEFDKLGCSLLETRRAFTSTVSSSKSSSVSSCLLNYKLHVLIPQQIQERYIRVCVCANLIQSIPIHWLQILSSPITLWSYGIKDAFLLQFFLETGPYFQHFLTL